MGGRERRRPGRAQSKCRDCSVQGGAGADAELEGALPVQSQSSAAEKEKHDGLPLVPNAYKLTQPTSKLLEL